MICMSSEKNEKNLLHQNLIPQHSRQVKGHSWSGFPARGHLSKEWWLMLCLPRSVIMHPFLGHPRRGRGVRTGTSFQGHQLQHQRLINQSWIFSLWLSPYDPIRVHFLQEWVWPLLLSPYGPIRVHFQWEWAWPLCLSPYGPIRIHFLQEWVWPLHLSPYGPIRVHFQWGWAWPLCLSPYGPIRIHFQWGWVWPLCLSSYGPIRVHFLWEWAWSLRLTP